MKKEYHLKSAYPEIILLPEGQNEPEQVTKVGIVPFIPHAQAAQWQFMLMKPQPEVGHVAGAPEFQMAKGTRRINMGNGWCDMRDDDVQHADPMFFETLIEAALREGEEEIGLRRANIKRLYDLGVYSIMSARKKVSKAIHVFAAEVNEADNFGAYESKTAEAAWMTIDAIASTARDDHTAIMQELCTRLIRYYK